MSELFIWQSYDLSRSWQSLPCHGGPKYLQLWSQSVQPQFLSCSPITSPLIPPLSPLSPLFQESTSYQGFSAGWAVKYFLLCAGSPLTPNPSVDDSLHLVVQSKGEHPSKQPCQKSRPCSCYLGQVNLVWNSRLFWICKCYIPICSVLLLPLLTRDFRT